MKLTAFGVAALGLIATSAWACPDLSGNYQKSCTIDSDDHQISYEAGRFPDGKLTNEATHGAMIYNLGFYSVRADGTPQKVKTPDLDGRLVPVKVTATCNADQSLQVITQGETYGLPFTKTEVYSLDARGDLKIKISDQSGNVSDPTDPSSDNSRYSVTCKRSS